MDVETSFAPDKKATADVAADGKVTPQEQTDLDDGLSADIPMGGDPAKKPEEKATPEDKGTEKPEDKPAEGDEQEKPPVTEAPPDLGEYKADDPEVVAKFDGQYFNEEGKLNKDALTAEFWGNKGEDGKNALRDSTYAWLTDRLGVSKELAQELEAGLVAKQQQGHASIEAGVHEAAGGKPKFVAALAWAQKADAEGKSPYTKEQQARFDRIVSSQAEGWEDAVTALVARYDAANPQASQKLPNLRRRSSPDRDITTERGGRATTATTSPATTSTAQPFKDNEEYIEALKDARNDPRKSAAVRERLRVSPWAAA